MKQDIVEALKRDELLYLLCQQIASSERLRAGVMELAKRVAYLDTAERAGLPVNNASALVVFDGGQVTSVLNVDDSLQIRGGGFTPLPRKKTGIS